MDIEIEIEIDIEKKWVGRVGLSVEGREGMGFRAGSDLVGFVLF